MKYRIEVYPKTVICPLTGRGKECAVTDLIAPEVFIHPALEHSEELALLEILLVLNHFHFLPWSHI